MWARRTVQKHGISARDRHVERPDFCLAVLEWDVPAVDAGFHRRACLIGGRLGYSVVAVAELELHDVADGGNNRIGDEGVLWAADDDGDNLVGAAVRLEPRESGCRSSNR